MSRVWWGLYMYSTDSLDNTAILYMYYTDFFLMPRLQAIVVEVHFYNMIMCMSPARSAHFVLGNIK